MHWAVQYVAPLHQYGYVGKPLFICNDGFKPSLTPKLSVMYVIHNCFTIES